jgi:hypothetical protein
MIVLYPDIKPYAEHRLDVDGTHTLHVEESGHCDGIPCYFSTVALVRVVNRFIAVFLTLKSVELFCLISEGPGDQHLMPRFRIIRPNIS